MSKKGERVTLPTPKTRNQKLLINALVNRPLTVVTGPAGTGKTFIAAACAAYLYREGRVEKIVITRPTVPVSRSIGFLPGELLDKLMPWALPITTTLEDFLGKGEVECMLKNGKIEIIPFETIRGRSFDRTFMILDEAQNATVEEMKAFTTRIGEDTTCVVNGDISQSDLDAESGLSSMLDVAFKIPDWIDVVEFTVDDIVRSGLCKELVVAWAAVEAEACTVGLPLQLRS